MCFGQVRWSVSHQIHHMINFCVLNKNLIHQKFLVSQLIHISDCLHLYKMVNET